MPPSARIPFRLTPALEPLMAELTISAAARHCGVDRRTLQRAIASGRLTRTASGQVTLEALAAAGYRHAAPHQDAAPLPQGEMPEGRHAAEAPQQDAAAMPQELALATTLLTHLRQLTSTIAALHQEVVLLREDLRRQPQRRRSLTPQGDAVGMADAMPQDAAPVPHHNTLTPQETPQDVAETPQVAPQMVPHAAVAPQSAPATPASPTTLAAHILRIAEVAAEYDKLSLAELSQLLYTRHIYRTTDRATGEGKPVNRGTLLKWLGQARQAGVL